MFSSDVIVIAGGLVGTAVAYGLGHLGKNHGPRPGAGQPTEAVAQAIARHAADGRQIRAAMLARLGPNVWHDTPPAALGTTR